MYINVVIINNLRNSKNIHKKKLYYKIKSYKNELIQGCNVLKN